MDYKIFAVDETDDRAYPLWWSNDAGWVSFENSDTFTVEERKELTLPLGGEWAEYEDYRYFAHARGVH